MNPTSTPRDDAISKRLRADRLASFFAGTLVAVALFAFFGSVNKAVGQAPARTGSSGPSGTTATGGRYQLYSVGSGSDPYLFLLDTQTGRLLYRTSPSNDQIWKDATPTELRKP